MKTLGAFLIVVGILCIATVCTGFAALMVPIDDAAPSPASVAESVAVRVFLLFGAGVVCIIGGAVTLVRGIRNSRHQTREGTKPRIRKSIAVTLVATTVFVCLIFPLFKFLTRWNADEEWAAKVIEESTEIQLLLEEFREENGEFPMSLNEIDEDYTRPTDFLTRNVAAPDTGRWHYDRIGPEDYQLYVTAYSWVSYHDALVYRHSGVFSEPWFSNLDASHSREFGNWRYVRGFSRYDEKYYFDADGDFHQR